MKPLRLLRRADRRPSRRPTKRADRDRVCPGEERPRRCPHPPSDGGNSSPSAFRGSWRQVSGLVYATGAFSKMAEVLKAGYEPAQIFPLIPTEQFLSRGLAVLLDPWSLLLVFVLLTSFLSNLSVREGMIRAGSTNGTTASEGASRGSQPSWPFRSCCSLRRSS